MAFDYGSIDLGLRNPFKKEGAATTIRGVIVALMGVYLLIDAAATVKNETVGGWLLVGFGMLLLGGGIASASGGILAMLRYFVGRNHPTSLAYNHSRSESSTAKTESSYVAYTKQKLIEMLVGRKNSTFVEPIGILARFVHSIFPRLTYMPYPIRNMAQRLFGAWIKTIVALIAFAFVAFVSLAGFAGELGEFAFPFYTALLTIYLLNVWRNAGTSINRNADRSISSMGNMELVRVIAGAILLPVIVGLSLKYALSMTQTTISELQQVSANFPTFHSTLLLLGLLAGAAVTSAIAFIMLKKRLNYSDPKVEVSELRENWQESIHPNEIFINLDNLVMANRRYKEVPNRVYQELDPDLIQQVEGKGKFFGEMIQEIQPKVKTMELGDVFKKMRAASLILGNVLFVISAILTMILAYQVVDLTSLTRSIGFDNIHANMATSQLQELAGSVSTIVHIFLSGLLLRTLAQIQTNTAHLFYSEILFESDLIYLKVEGTFTESKISTGNSIHDSTRSENVLVRSSITPWVIVCRIVSSTFASTGMQNLEHPRLILEMHKNEQELAGIRDDIISFLKDRESIASITSNRDLQNASQIHEINQQSRAIPMQSQNQLNNMDEEAAGFIKHEHEKQQDETEDAKLDV
ncbi:hypothetical protein D5018_15740 [Parashewanella curva]|uniref:Uncharacterized protein n=1 Tax=Parashewanella curva TaxID=2338552 RepID=A0A3L8PVE8_9GAMM|nr:hypothetical protein [Parashewanella curva]RLV58749.1 hypothetical protein D5018_15740 [Parashewanella curva]